MISREKALAYGKKYRDEHADERREKYREWYLKKGVEYHKQWRLNNPDKVKASSDKYRKKLDTPRRETSRVWREKNKEKIREYNMDHREIFRRAAIKWRASNIEKAKLNVSKWRRLHPEDGAMRRIVQHMLSISECKKESKSYKYIGCSPGFLRNHIESLFKPGMTWSNYGEWHIDHIVPLSWWDTKNYPEHLYVASHWTNLQPLWAIDNRSKNNRYAYATPPKRVVA